MEQSILSILIIIVAIILFATEKIPLAMTAVLTALAMAVFGIIRYEDALSGFGSPTLMMVAGMIIIGNALFETGLAQTMGTCLLKLVGTNEKLFLLLVMLLAALFSAFLSNTATVAMFIPLIASVASRSKGKISKKNSYMALGVLSVVGGNCTIVGSTPQLIAQGILAETKGCRTIGFFELSYVAVPLVVISIVYFITFGYSFQKKIFDFEEINDERYSTNEEKPPVYRKSKMIISGLVLIGCIAGFILEVWNVGIISIMGAAILIVTGCVNEKKAYRDVDWSTVIILGSAIGFSKGLEVSGGGKLIADAVLRLFGGENASPFVILAAIIVVSMLLGNFMSHTASAAMMTPIVIDLALAIRVDPVIFVIGTIIACNLAFATPVGTPPMTLTLAGGYRFKDYVKIGGALTVLLTVSCIWLVPAVYGL